MPFTSFCSVTVRTIAIIMKLFAIALILTIHGVIGDPQAGASAGGGGDGSAGGSADGSAGGSAGGAADGSMSGGANAGGSAQPDGCSLGGSAGGQANGGASGSGSGQVDGGASGSAGGQAGGSAGGDASMAGAVDGSAGPAAAPDAVQGFLTIFRVTKTYQSQPFDENEFVSVQAIDQDSIVTYKKRIDMDTSPTCEGSFSVNNTEVYRVPRNKPAKVCGPNEPGTYADLLAHIYLAGFTPAQSCPVEPGNYPCPKQMPPFTIPMKKKMKCGTCKYFGNCDTSKGGWITQLMAEFTLSGDQCDPSL